MNDVGHKNTADAEESASVAEDMDAQAVQMKASAAYPKASMGSRTGITNSRPSR